MLSYPSAGQIGGAAGGSALLGALGRLAAPLDWPRAALWNVPKKLSEGDFVGALPGLAGLAAGGLTAATGLGLPLAATVGSLVGGIGQGVGRSVDEDRFSAPSPEDVTGSDNPLVNALAGAVGDPLTYAGGLGGAKLGGRAAKAAETGTGSPLLRFLGEEAGAAKVPLSGGAAKEASPLMEALQVGGGKPPEKGFVVANMGADGKIYYGQPGDLHYSLQERFPGNARGEWLQEGFAGPDGRFLTREEAARALEAAGGKPAPGGWLDAEAYRNAARPDVTPGPVNLSAEPYDQIVYRAQRLGIYTTGMDRDYLERRIRDKMTGSQG